MGKKQLVFWFLSFDRNPLALLYGSFMIADHILFRGIKFSWIRLILLYKREDFK